MSGLAEFFTEEDICMQCRKITAMEKTMMDQQKRLTELEHIVKSLSERVAAERTKSYAEIVKESAPSETRKEGIREITVKSKEPKTSPAPRRPRNTFVYVGEEAESVSVEKRVVLIGDSNVRQVGQNLAEQSNKFVTICQPGAKLEDVQEILDSTHKDGDTCVIEVGTNNLFSDEKADIIKKFQFILQELKKRRRRVVVMGILPRRLSREMERKRTSVNEELWELCQSEGAEFLNADFDVWDRYLGKDGLHLNRYGADKIARKIFACVKCCCKALN